MAEPFEINDYLGHLIVLKLLSGVALLWLTCAAYKFWLKKEEERWQDLPDAR